MGSGTMPPMQINKSLNLKKRGSLTEAQMKNQLQMNQPQTPNASLLSNASAAVHTGRKYGYSKSAPTFAT